MKLRFLGATHCVTGSKYLLTMDKVNILIDCGLFQGRKELRLRNWETFPIEPSKIDAVVLTHAHLDHTGYLPLLVKNGFRGKIYCTAPTKDLCGVLLPDSGFLQEELANFANKHGFSKHKPALPLYTEKDAVKSLENIVALEFGKEYQLYSDITLQFNRAGHILGAATVMLRHYDSTILFSGEIRTDLKWECKVPEYLAEEDLV